MQCPNCHHPNRESAKFCEACGTAVGERTCAGCGAGLRASAKFCDACGRPVGASPEPPRINEPRTYTPHHLAEKILTSRSAVEGERKQVTILFADVKGSMELAEQLDAEQFTTIMQRFFRILAEGVGRFEGFVDKFTGDGIMALFGAPIAHEDHAQRACFAALHLKETLRDYAEEVKRAHGVSFSIRMGVNSGTVVVGKISDDLRMDYTAQGHAVGLAQRMEQLASPGSVYVAEGTAKLVGGYFTLRDLGGFRIKGSDDPVSVYELEGLGELKSRLDMSRSRGLTRFVGRAREMAALETALERSLTGHGQVVGVVAEAGAGKSRLCYEFVESCRARGISVYEGHCPPHGKTIPFLPVLEVLRGFFGLSDRDSKQAAREKVVGRLLLLDRSLEAALPMVFDFFGIAEERAVTTTIDAGHRQQQLLQFVQNLIRARSDREPAVLFFDDLHWIDAGSDEFVARAVETVSSTRTLMLVNFRPEYEAEWTRRSYYQQLSLVPLGVDALAELLVEMLGADPSVARLPRLIAERGGGNPFFTEEIVQSLVESGHLVGSRGAYKLAESIDSIDVPTSVVALLGARIDRLPDREKQLLQTAAVIGRDFGRHCLERVVGVDPVALDAALQALSRAELVFEKAIYPEREYTFKHPLTHEVAYESQLGERRKRVHADVARAIEDLYAGQLDSQAAALARHWKLAGQSLTAARWGARAADLVGVSDASLSAAQWLEVYALTRGMPGEEPELLAMRACLRALQMGAWRLEMNEAEVDALYEHGRALGRTRGDNAYLAELTYSYAPHVGIRMGDTRRWLELGADAIRLADASGDSELTPSARMTTSYALFVAGQVEASERMVHEIDDLCAGDVELGRRTVGFSLALWSRQQGGWMRAVLGDDLDAARETLASIDSSVRQHDERELLCWSNNTWALLERFSGVIADGDVRAHEAVATAESLGSPFSLAHTLNGLAIAQAARGKWDESIIASERALEIITQKRIAVEAEPGFLATYADALLGAGRLDEARSAAESSISRALERFRPIAKLEAEIILARILLADGNAAEHGRIADLLDSAAEGINATSARVFEPFVLMARAELARKTRDEAAQRAHLTAALKCARAMNAAGHVARLEAELSAVDPRQHL
jgi:class 3 adenylate cyclase/tetratricopeptide (TPR) repeat protein